MLTLKCFNSTLISIDASLVTLLLIGKGVRFLTCSESSRKTFLYALTIYFFNANSVMSGKQRMLRQAQDERGSRMLVDQRSHGRIVYERRFCAEARTGGGPPRTIQTKAPGWAEG